MDSSTSRNLTIALVALVVLFVVILFLIVSRQPSAVPPTVVPAVPTVVTGTPPLKVSGSSVGPPNTIPWSNVSPPFKRPTNSFQKILGASASPSSQYALNTTQFINTDASSSSQQPFCTVLVVPSSWPLQTKVFRDQEAVTQPTNPAVLAPSVLDQGILPDLLANGNLNQVMSDIDLTGVSQLAFGFQNQTNQSLYFVINTQTNEQFEVPAGKTAVFQSVSSFWTVLQFRNANPGKLGVQAQLQWVGGIVPLAKGAQPLAKCSTQEEARNVAAAEVEALYAQRGSQ